MPQSQARLAPAQYTFAPASKQITFAGVPGFVLDGLIEVLHVPSGNVLYDAYDPTLGGTVAGNVLTLAFDTTGTYGAGTAYTSADPLRIIYNDLTREDQLLVYTPTATGVFATVPVKGFMQAILQVLSTQSFQCQVYGSLDGNFANAVRITGLLPDLPANPGDVNSTSGSSFNLRYYEIGPYRFLHINCTNYTASSTPVVNLALKTTPPPHHLNYIVGGTVGVSFDSGAPIGYIRTTSLSPEVVRGTLQSGATVTTGTLTGGVLSAGAVITGGPRQAFGQPAPFFSRFGATVISDQSGSLIIQASTDSTNWITVSAPQAVTGGVPLDFEVKVRANFYRVVYTNGSTATGANVFSLLAAFCAS